jgi:7 transmembrane sweet-taste receptor of 3 GCPR
VSLKSIPTWITLYDNRMADRNRSVGQGDKIDLMSGERVTLELCASTDQLETGTAVASVAFGIWNGGESNRYLGCTGQDVTFDVFMRVAPSQDLNQLGSISIMGFVLAAVVSCTASYFCYYVLRHKKLRIVSTMQPLFLVAICIGVFIMGLALIPLGLDDGKVSEHGANIACMAIPWLFSMGFTITQSALFSKLWRINKLFNSPQMRRMQVHEKDVLGPFALLFILNFTILLVWTVVDPLQYDRKTVDGEIWNSYGHCDSDGSVGATLFALNCCVNIAALLCACYQAYKARNISDEFSESSNIGMAMFSWIQLVIIGVPVLFLINGDNPMARYFILASLMFAGKCGQTLRYNSQSSLVILTKFLMQFAKVCCYSYLFLFFCKYVNIDKILNVATGIVPIVHPHRRCAIVEVRRAAINFNGSNAWDAPVSVV